MENSITKILSINIMENSITKILSTNTMGKFYWKNK